MIMSIHGAVAPVVYGGKIRAVMAYLDRQKLQARGLSPLDVMKAIDDYNVFLPDRRRQVRRHRLRPRLELDVRLPSTRWATSRSGPSSATPPTSRRGDAQGRHLHPDQRRAGQRQAAGVHPGLPPARGQHARRSSTRCEATLEEMTARLTRGGIDLKLVMDQSVYVRQSIESLVAGGGARGGALLAGRSCCSWASGG